MGHKKFDIIIAAKRFFFASSRNRFADVSGFIDAAITRRHSETQKSVCVTRIPIAGERHNPRPGLCALR